MASLKGRAFLSFLALTLFTTPSLAGDAGLVRRHHRRIAEHAKRDLNGSHHHHTHDRRAPPHGYTYQGCMEDGGPRTLTGGGYAAADMTVDSCVDYCFQRNFIFAGIEYSQECFCGNNLYPGRTYQDEATCNMQCGGSTEICGGPNRLSLYSSGATPPPPPAAPTAPPTVGDWEYVSCYSDNVNGHALTHGVGLSGPATIQLCTSACQNAGYTYAGLEYGGECYCDSQIRNGGAPVTDGCTMTCNGDSSQLCGGPNRLTVYHFTGTPPTPPSNPPTIGDWANVGCWSDNVNGRALPFAVGTGGQNSLNSCTAACFAAGYTFAGTEYGAECWCNDNRGVMNGGAQVPSSECSMPCQANPQQFCGAGNRLSVYQYNGTPTSGEPTPSSSPSATPSAAPTPVGDFKYAGCYVDGINGRVLPIGGDIPGSTVSVESCSAACESKGYEVAGMEYSAECYCGHQLINGPTLAPDSECNMNCAGNANQKCGGPGRISVWSTLEPVPIRGVPVPQQTDLPPNWEYQGCYHDGEAGQPRILPNQIISQTNTAEECLTQCEAFGYPAAGMEYGQECYCGDISDIVTKSAGPAPDAQCGTPCSGDPESICGGGNRLTLYYNNQTLANWHEPANKGRYEYWMPGIVIPLIATVGINNKVTFLEKFGTGYPNTTGAYELDPSLVPDQTKAWREMHVTSDVFCAASLILPDKAGRQINIGGWSFESTFGIRLYAPDGSLGVNGTNDWEENYEALHLQRGRWYPTALIMANSSILVIGGQKGSNDVPEPTLELLPKPDGGDTTVFLDWLQRTDPNNLYPFLTVLKNGDIFVAYYNEARIISKDDFSTVKVLPMIPGAVNHAGAGRTYPLEGAFVQLPLSAPYVEPIGVLICGGSAFGEALDNCVSIYPEEENPQWTVERMPSRRVMSCMTPLPDGTFLIANGAKQGVAGFGLGENPNFSALLYDPYQPVHSRISIMDTTDIARMYHSETSLMPDGSVLVSGSDSQTAWPNGTQWKYPQEFRLELFLPPYLTDGRVKPTYTIVNKDWAYEQNYQVVITSGSTANIRFSLVAATSSTHGNTMGGRTLFPAFTCIGNVCTIIAPPLSVSPPGWHMLFALDGPTPSVAQWVRIGGDPAHLGEWPNYPGFNPPGM